MTKISEIRNVVFLGHGSSGKTSLVEALLHKNGMTNRLGRVEDKTTVSDYDDEEKDRGHSIQASICHANYNGKLFNLIDTPGYPGFIGGALQSIVAADTAVIVINAAAGIEVNTRRLYAAATKANLPKIIVINKMESENVDLAELVQHIKETFGNKCKCANLPNTTKDAVIDCVSKSEGNSLIMSVEEAHTEVLESVIEADEELMELYLSGEEVSAEKVQSFFSKAMLAGTIIPIVFTNARDEVGIMVLDEILEECVPTPKFSPPRKLIDGENVTEIYGDPDGPLAALVFKISFDARSHMKFAHIRIFSGRLKSDTPMYHNHDRKPLRPGHILRAQGADTEEIPEAVAGELICLAKIDELKVGDLLHDGSLSGHFETSVLPRPMYSLAIESSSKGDESKIGVALEKLSEEDCCFKVTHDAQTKELVINGMDDLHLRVILAKMEHSYKLKVDTKQPKIPYHETIMAKAEGHYKHRKQSGGAGQFGEVFLRIEPAERNSEPTLQTSWDIFGGSIPGQFEAPIVKGVHDVMDTGFLAGFPLQDIKVSIYDGKHHPVDSKEVAFRAAGKGAFLDALEKAKPTLLEPMVHLDVTIPTEYMGDITSDMSGRRGRIQGQDMLPGNLVVLKALVPLAEVSTYNSQLKSVTGGRGSYTMELSHYEPVPSNVQQQVIDQYNKDKEIA